MPYHFVRIPFCPYIILSVPLCPYHSVHTILSNTILSVYQFVHTILSVPFCPRPFCPVTARRNVPLPSYTDNSVQSATGQRNIFVINVHMARKLTRALIRPRIRLHCIRVL